MRFSHYYSCPVTLLFVRNFSIPQKKVFQEWKNILREKSALANGKAEKQGRSFFFFVEKNQKL